MLILSDMFLKTKSRQDLQDLQDLNHWLRQNFWPRTHTDKKSKRRSAEKQSTDNRNKSAVDQPVAEKA
jgi:hypothetical protein